MLHSASGVAGTTLAVAGLCSIDIKSMDTDRHTIYMHVYTHNHVCVVFLPTSHYCSQYFYRFCCYGIWYIVDKRKVLAKISALFTHSLDGIVCDNVIFICSMKGINANRIQPNTPLSMWYR